MDIIFSVMKRFFTDRFHDQSAQMAYFFMLAIFPLLIFVVSLLSYLPIYSGDVLTVIEPFAPKGSYQLIKSNLISILDQQRTKLLSFSFIATFWIASMAVQSLVRAMNDAYQITRNDRFFIVLLKDMLLTAVLMATLAISLFIPIIEEIARIFVYDYRHLLPGSFHWWTIAKWAISSIYLFLFFNLLYKYVPSTKIHFLSVIPGALFATAGWQAVSVGFSYYVSFADYSQLYGQLGSIVVLMSWFYLTAAVLLTGGLINAAYIEKRPNFN
ncbi:YihY/virulence factor BrkB family protein [Lederbergia lenta]|uniref:YihY family protein n=1 Tax=Lederbergia lenta TaxID=1467 RepID=A0A2X4X021_LEDLE|nr:YihY/virulence factor BrkB family protein [Lederbergia lenta]MCM3112197.1 YihY/virulence factor BrkB family protein [Lederbergia lenta]MEC2323364.1 YihY/virulence factor BrkB family protein [Lederbergia lenta]SQI63290.1 YihY family protein [Lederbergia lenta]